MSKRAVIKVGKKVKSSEKAVAATIQCRGCGRPIIVGMHPGVVISNLTVRCSCGMTTTINASG
jgi:hypothetical protein